MKMLMEDPPECDLLAEALAASCVVVEERGERPTISQLTLRVQGLRPVLVPEGEILKGGLQTCTVNITLLLAGRGACTPCLVRREWPMGAISLFLDGAVHLRFRIAPKKGASHPGTTPERQGASLRPVSSLSPRVPSILPHRGVFGNERLRCNPR